MREKLDFYYTDHLPFYRAVSYVILAMTTYVGFFISILSFRELSLGELSDMAVNFLHKRSCMTGNVVGVLSNKHLPLYAYQEMLDK